jgi:hypothetical protein
MSKIKAAAPDWVYVTGYTQDLVLARKQMSEFGVKAPIVAESLGHTYYVPMGTLENFGIKKSPRSDGSFKIQDKNLGFAQ